MYNYTACNDNHITNFVADGISINDVGQIAVYIGDDIIAIFPATTILTRQGNAETV